MITWRALSVWLITVLVAHNLCSAQLGGFGGVGGGAGVGNNANDGQNSAGIAIDAEGVVRLTVEQDGSGALDKKRREAIARKVLPADLNRKSKRRIVSLVGLEKELARRLDDGEAISTELFYLAGLQRIEYVFVDPAEHDVVIAGPAEGFVPDLVGRMIGVESGRPTSRLDDLLIALRSVPKAKQVGCSIDPVPQRLADLQQFIKNREPASPEEVAARFNQMDDILGLQDVRIDGVPPDSHFATLLVEADYRMKRIAIGLEHPGVKGLKSHLALMGSNGNTIQRWWFVPDYDSIARSPDAQAFQLTGQRARLLTDEEFADSNGNRFSTGAKHKSTQVFAKLFTEKFSQIADRSPVFGELQNLIDWTILAALLHKEQIPQRIGWTPKLLLDVERLRHPVFATPRRVPSSVNYKRTTNLIVGLVCGGVVVSPLSAYEASATNASQPERLDATRDSAVTARRASSVQWWWDEE